MKKNRVIIIAFILISKLTLAQDLSWSDFNLKNKVKSVSEVSHIGKLTTNGYIKVQKGWETSWELDSKTEFDTSGNKVSKTYYNKYSKVVRTDHFVFENGRLLKSIMLHHTRNYKYDSSGKLISMTEKNRQPNQINASNANNTVDEKLSTYDYKYDTKNKLIEKTELDSKGLKIGITKYEYDESERLIKEKTTFEDYEEWYEYIYDSNGNLKTKKWYDSDEGILEKVTNIYKNNIKIYEYWENYAEGLLEGKISYTFEKGNEKKIVESDDSGNIDATWNYQYKYDSKGNWTEQIITFNNKDIFIIDRKLEYY